MILKSHPSVCGGVWLETTEADWFIDTGELPWTLSHL